MISSSCVAHGVSRNAYWHAIKSAQGRGPLFPLRLDSLRVKVQSRVKISRTNLHDIGGRSQFTKLEMGKKKREGERGVGMRLQSFEPS